ncbi:MAG: GntR family transcriptional regulator [Microbacterium sp.]
MYKHIEIQRALESRIEQLSPGDMLPQERELAEIFGASRATVRQSLRALIAEGKIKAVRGKGTFVADQSVTIGQRIASFSEDMQARGLAPSAQLLEAVEVDPPRRVQNALNVDEGDCVYRIRRLRQADGLPMCLEVVYLPARLYPWLLESDLTGSLYETLSRRHHISVARADQRVTAALLDKEESRLLDVSPPAPALLVQRVGFDTENTAVEYGESKYRADRYDVRISGVR